MGKISNVYYNEVDPKKFNVKDAADLYFYQGFLDTSKDIAEKYCRLEESQMQVRSSILGAAIRSGEIPKIPDVHTATIGVSSLKNSVVLIVNC